MIAEASATIQLVNAFGAISLAIVFLVLFWRGEIVSRPVMDKYITALMSQFIATMEKSVLDISSRVIAAVEARLEEHDRESKLRQAEVLEHIRKHDEHVTNFERDVKDELRD